MKERREKILMLLKQAKRKKELEVSREHITDVRDNLLEDLDLLECRAPILYAHCSEAISKLNLKLLEIEIELLKMTK
jgi:hypothetical protein